VSTFRTDFSDLTEQFGGKTLQHVKTVNNARRALSWDDPGSATDVEVLALLSITRPTTERFTVFLRGAGSGGSETGIGLGIDYDNGVTFIQIASGTLTTVNSSLSIRAGQRMWVRGRANGSNVRVKVWMLGDPEPSTWAIDQTTTVTGSGWVGLYAIISTGQPKYCDFFSADMAGGTAPGLGETPGTNQYSTDFSTQSVGTPADWTARWTTTNSTWSIVDSVSNVLPAEIRAPWIRSTVVHTLVPDNTYEGGKCFVRTYGSAASELHQFYQEPEWSDGNVYAVVRSPDTQTATNTTGGFFRASVGIRTAGSGSDRYGYFFGPVHHPVTDQTRRWGLFKFNVVPFTPQRTFLYFSAPDKWVSDEFYEVRLEAVGDTIRARYWLQGDYEPSTWEVEVTDNALTSGRAGLYSDYGPGTTPNTTQHARWDVLEWSVYPEVFGDFNGSFSPLSSQLEAEKVPSNLGELNSSFSPLSSQLEADLLEPAVFSGALAFQSSPEDPLLEVPVLSVTESGRAAPQARRRFSGKVSTDMMTIGANPDDRRPRLWDIQTGYMTHDLAADVLHQLTAGGYFYVSGYIIGALRLVSASEINYQEGDMPDLVQLSFVLRTR